MTDHRSNHARLQDILATPVGEIATLPAAQLAILQEEAEAALDAARRQKEHLDRAIAHRFADQADAVRRAEGKDTGTVRLEDGPVTVVADLPKRVEWDQKHLAGLVERIRASGEDPADYVEVTLKVPERRYAAWPPALRETFEPARTVKTGKPSFTLTLTDGSAA
jgi:hypothetical protein